MLQDIFKRFIKFYGKEINKQKISNENQLLVAVLVSFRPLDTVPGFSWFRPISGRHY